MFSIGEFSRITGLTVKTLRFYHEKGVLVPDFVDQHTGYRNYGSHQFEKARIITRLRSLEFSLEVIGEILANYDDESDLIDHLERQKSVMEAKSREAQEIVASLKKIIQKEKDAGVALQNSTFEVEEKELDTFLMAGVRMKGHYRDSGQGFARIGKSLGRHISGKCFLLHYDDEYQEEADFEACMPIRQARNVEGISVRKLPGGRCVCLLHKGPYEDLGYSYAKIMKFIKEKRYEILMPTREVYLKGPGMIFRGNPQNYLTEIQMLIKNS